VKKSNGHLWLNVLTDFADNFFTSHAKATFDIILQAHVTLLRGKVRY
jgi:hypothetical protein